MIDKPCELCDSPGGDLLWRDGFCRIVLVDDPDYPGFCRVVLERHVKEMTDLEPAERTRLMNAVFATEAALENAIEGMRIHGAYGYSKEFDIERLYRDAPLTCIGEGTNEMQRIIISKQLIKRNPAA